MLGCAVTYILLITEHNGDVSPENCTKLYYIWSVWGNVRPVSVPCLWSCLVALCIWNSVIFLLKDGYADRKKKRIALCGRTTHFTLPFTCSRNANDCHFVVNTKPLFSKLLLSFTLRFCWCTEKVLKLFLTHKEFNDSMPDTSLFFINAKCINEKQRWFSCKNQHIKVLISKFMFMPLTGKFLSETFSHSEHRDCCKLWY